MTARLRSISPDATPEEVAAIVAAVSALVRRAPAPDGPGADRSRWVAASRLTARRCGLARGEWRLSGRIGRRARA